jgi:hypothetical protein
LSQFGLEKFIALSAAHNFNQATIMMFYGSAIPEIAINGGPWLTMRSSMTFSARPFGFQETRNSKI